MRTKLRHGALTLALVFASASFVYTLVVTSNTTATTTKNHLNNQTNYNQTSGLQIPPIDSSKQQQLSSQRPQIEPANEDGSSHNQQAATTILPISPNIQITTSTGPTPTAAKLQQASSELNNSNNCSSVCSMSDYATILQRITQDEDILRGFKEANDLAVGRNKTGNKFYSAGKIKPLCVRELINLIKGLASNELELKTLLEFASDSLDDEAFQVLAPGSSKLESDRSAQPVSGAKVQKLFPSSEGSGSWAAGPAPKSVVSLDLSQIRWLQAGIAQAAAGSRIAQPQNAGCQGQQEVADYATESSKSSGQATAAQQQQQQMIAANSVEDPMQPEANEKSRLLSKMVANVDHWINTLERFTVTREWSSLMKVFEGTEAILGMFVKATGSGNSNKKLGKQKQLTAAASAESAVKSKVEPIAATGNLANTTEFIEGLKKSLPTQVLTLTSSLNNLFPWHVWPWNNLDLYTTVDTFLNHGIFAFSKTTVGPERRIDYLANMLQTLFKSLNYDTFPKKCTDWSRIICDKATFFDRLDIGPAPEMEAKDREAKVREMSANSKSQLTQELACIMFSSLSMKQFGAVQDNSNDQVAAEQTDQLTGSPVRGLAWDKQVHKALKLYTLSREALTDEQWLSIYNLINDLWAQQKITDRVVMVGRVVQLLTNCHMPKEMLESALWKDIYKYKNVLNQLIDIAVEELNRSSETGKLTIEQIALGSSSLHEILRKFIKLLPKLIESLSRTVVDQLPELVGKFFAEKAAFFRVPCKGHSFSDIIPSLNKYRTDIIEIERLVCGQLRTKPNITMMQINNLTNDFLAMAFNFSNFGGALALPKLLTGLDGGGSARLPVQTTTQAPRLKDPTLEEPGEAANVTSIVDEMAANPRLAAIVAILQSSALDPPEVHAELPELDWVEAGTSVALLYDSIQKLISYEEVFTIFPEIGNFQEEMKGSVEGSRQMFKKFSKRDPIRLLAYSLDAAMPIALRTFKPMDSFHAECLSSFRDIFSGEDMDLAGGGTGSKATRQWQCVVSSMNFGSWALNKFMATFNNMFKNILTQMTSESAGRKLANSRSLLALKQQAIEIAQNSSGANSTSGTCIFFDGSVSIMLDNLPQFIDLALETVLMASTSSDQQMTLYDIMCSSNYMLDPFNERSVELKARMKDKMCHLFHKSSLANCAEVLRLDQWTSTMRELNSTWFESNVLAIAPSFREITLNVHEFLELFGQFKPSTMSDSLLARVLNVNSFWTNSLNRIMGIMDKYQEKRFEYALQTLTPIIYDNLPTTTASSPASEEDSAAASTELPVTNPPAVSSGNSSRQLATVSAAADDLAAKEVRETLITTILGARAILHYLLDKQQPPFNQTLEATGRLQTFEAQIQSLFDWADQYLLISAESLLRTMANRIDKLERVFGPEQTGNATTNQSVASARLSLSQIWQRFCSAPIDTYLDLPVNETSTGSNSTEPSAQLSEGKDAICRFEWLAFYNKLGADSNKVLAEYPERQLTRIALTKWGQVLDVMLIESKHIKQLPKFFYMDYWQEFSQKLPQITPLKDQPSNLVWIWAAFERLVNAMDAPTKQMTTSGSLVRILEQLNCGLDAVKGGLSWENLGNIYSDKQDILAAHNTINNGFALISIGVNTFLRQRKFQKFLDKFVKPRVGLNAFCELRDRAQLESIFSIPPGDEFLSALESFQELICDTNFETLAQNINPISVCYQLPVAAGSSQVKPQPPTTTIAPPASGQQQPIGPLADIMDRFFKLASLAILDAKLVAQSEAKPPILDKNQWAAFWNWRTSGRPQDSKSLVGGGHPKSGVALAVVRAFQTIDSINSDHVVWKALFRSVHEVSEVVAYLLRAVEKRHQEVDMIGAASRLSLIGEAASQIDSAIRSGAISSQLVTGGKQIQQQQQLASTLSNIMFPEVNNFISFRTFKQLRYIKTISEYFAQTPGAQESVCRAHYHRERRQVPRNSRLRNDSDATRRIELIGFKLDTNDKLYTLLCHYHSSQWLTALNIVISTRTNSIPKKVNYMTKYLSIFTRSYKDTDNLDGYIHGQQLENIENVANTTVSYLLATSHSLKTLSFSKISNVSWHSLPNLLDSIDRHLCASKFEQGTFHIPSYEPKKPELETVLCKLPQWNITQVYSYLSENFDLQNMISLIAQHGMTTNKNITSSATISPTNSATPSHSTATTKLIDAIGGNKTQVASTSGSRACVTPFKFASRWLKIGQEIVDEAMSKATRDKIKKCLSLSRKGQSVYTESLRYVKLVNTLLSSINDLTSNDSWHSVKRTWNSVSYLILNQNPSYVSKLYR